MLIQCLNLITFLKRKKRSHLDELKERFGFEQEELLEMIESIQDVGIPPYGGGDYIQVIIDREGYVGLGSAQHFRGPVKLTLEEITALRLWLISTSAGGQPWRDVVKGLLEKIEDYAGDNSGLSMDIDRIREVKRRSHILATLDRAFRERKVIRLEYFSTWRDHIRRPEVESYGVIDRQGVWVLVGFDRGDQRIKNYRVDRVRHVEILEEKYEKKRDVDLDQYLKVDWGYPANLSKARVRARGPLKRELRAIASNCHEEGDHLVGDVTILSIPWFTSWLLAHPDHLDLVEGRELRGKIKERIQLLKSRL